MKHTPHTLHQRVATEQTPKLRFSASADFYLQQQAIRKALQGALRVPPMPDAPPQVTIAWQKTQKDYTEIRFLFESEPEFWVPAHLLLPKNGQAPHSVVICLQGHSTGMYLSLGERRFSEDWEDRDQDFAVQAVKQGYAAVALEQRGFGEQTGDPQKQKPNCQHMAMQALLLGRTLVGERCYDVSRLLDALAQFPDLNLQHVGLMGQSGGGTAAFYAACTEPRICAVMPSCSFCAYGDSIIALSHCTCNYLPGIAQQVDMGDLTILLAPRPLVVVAGEKDSIFPKAGVEREFAVAQQVYRAAGSADACRLVFGDAGHRFYAARGWQVFCELFETLRTKPANQITTG